MTRGFSVGIDIGGTFTDIVCAGPDGIATMKLATTLQDRSRAAAEALARLEREHGISPASVSRFVHGTTAPGIEFVRQGVVNGKIGAQVARRVYGLPEMEGTDEK